MRRYIILAFVTLAFPILAQQSKDAEQEAKEKNLKKVKSKTEFVVKVEKPLSGVSISSEKVLDEKEFDFKKFRKYILQKIKKSNKKLYDFRRKNEK